MVPGNTIGENAIAAEIAIELGPQDPDTTVKVAAGAIPRAKVAAPPDATVPAETARPVA